MTSQEARDLRDQMARLSREHFREMADLREQVVKLRRRVALLEGAADEREMAGVAVS